MKKAPTCVKAGIGLAVISLVINSFVVLVLGSSPLGFFLFITTLPTIILGGISEIFARCTENMFVFVVMTSVLYFLIGCVITPVLQRVHLPTIVRRMEKIRGGKLRPMWLNIILFVVIGYGTLVLLLVHKDLDPTADKLFLNLIQQLTHQPRIGIPFLVVVSFLAGIGLVYDRRAWTRILGFICIAFFSLNVFTVFFYTTSSLSLDMADIDKKDTKSLVEALNDKNWSVRADAAQALGKIGDKRAVEPLIRALVQKGEQNGALRERAAEALGELGNKRAIPYLIEALEDDYFWVRIYAAGSLGGLGDDRATETLIKALLEDEDQRVRSNAAESLGEIADERATEALTKALLEDGDDRVRYHAAEALGKIGDERAVGPLVAAFKDNDRSVPRTAAEALVRIGNPAVEPLIAVLKKDEDMYARYWAAWALGRIRDIRAMEPLIVQLEDENESVRKNASTALLYITGISFRDASRARKWLEQYRTAERLILALKDEDKNVQRNAAEEIVKIGSPAIKLLATVMENDESMQACYWAVWILKRIRDGRATTALIAALKRENRELRSNVIEALANKRGDCVVEALITTLKDEDQYIQCQAAEALRHKTGKDLGRDAAKWQEWWERKKESFHKEK